MAKSKIQKKKSRFLANKQAAAGRRSRRLGGYSSLRYICMFVLGIGLIAVSVGLFKYSETAGLKFTPLPSIAHTNETPDKDELLRLINDRRAMNNRTELKTDDQLTAVAEKRLQDMIDNQQYSHKDTAGKYFYDILNDENVGTSYACENLDLEPTAKPADFIKSWMSSGKGHRECLLSDKVSAVGIASGKFSTGDDKRDEFLVVTIFASKAGN